MIESYPGRDLAYAMLPQWVNQLKALKLPGLLFVKPVPGVRGWFGIFAVANPNDYGYRPDAS
jgi:hypothetical protein